MEKYEILYKRDSHSIANGTGNGKQNDGEVFHATVDAETRAAAEEWLIKYMKDAMNRDIRIFRYF